MDPLRKKLYHELEVMQQQTGRMLRSMSLGRMLPMESGNWQPPMDIYEAETEIYVFCELAGADKETLEVIVDEHRLRVSGIRHLPGQKNIACIHQLEIEQGRFSRTVALPSMVDIDSVQSSYHNGVLVVTLPKKQKKGKITIAIASGE